MFNYFIERPVFSTVIAVLIMLVGGARCILGCRSRSIRRSCRRRCTCRPQLPGRQREVVAQSVAAPIEQQVNGART